MNTQPVAVIERAVIRPIALAIVAMPIGFVFLVTIGLVNRSLPADYLAVAVAVPMSCAYVLIRVLGAMVPAPSQEERADAEAIWRRFPLPLVALVNVQLAAILIAIVFCAAAPIYVMLNMASAWIIALKIGGAAFGVAALTSICAGLLVIVIENHMNRGFVHQCHAICALALYEIGTTVRNARATFERTTSLIPVRNH